MYIPEGKELIHRVLVEALSEHVKKDGASVYSRHVLNEVISILQGSSYKHIHNFDSDLDWINLQNGLFNWRTGEFKEHTPEYFSRIQFPIYYDPKAECPNIEKLIETVAKPEDVQKCYEFFAYCLYRAYPIQKEFVLLGPGKTGKSSFMDILSSFLGSKNCSSVSVQDLAEDKFSSSDLYGKSANICGDLDKTALSKAGVIKRLTSTKDNVRAQQKGKPAFDFLNFAKLIFAANKLFPTEDDTMGYYRRIEILLFTHKFTDDEYDAAFLESTTSPNEISGLFNKVVKLLPDLLKRNEFTNQMSAEKVREIYEELSQSEESFFEKFVNEDPGEFASKKTLYNNYRTYCDKLGTPPMTMNKFGRWIMKHVHWIKNPNSSTTIGGISVAAWSDTWFNKTAFQEWMENL